MRAPISLFAVVSGVACAGPLPDLNPRPMGWDDRLEAARDHEQQAAEEIALARRAEVEGPIYACSGNPLLADQVGGGAMLSPWVGCWDTSYEDTVTHARRARDELEAADRDRAIAGEMLDAELAYCQGIPEDAPSLLSDARAVEVAVPVRDDDGEIRGARIVLAPGLAPAEVAHDISCHRARFAMKGMDHKYLSTDPTIVEGVNAIVRARTGQVEVVVTAQDEGDALVALWRAEDLARSSAQTATRE